MNPEYLRTHFHKPIRTFGKTHFRFCPKDRRSKHAYELSYDPIAKKFTAHYCYQPAAGRRWARKALDEGYVETMRAALAPRQMARLVAATIAATAGGAA